MLQAYSMGLVAHSRNEQRPELLQAGQKFDALVIGFDHSRKPNFSITALQIQEAEAANPQYGGRNSGASSGDIIGRS